MKDKTLFIDFDGTICHDRFWRTLSPAEYELIQSALFGRDTKLISDWMSGKYSSEEVNEHLALLTNIPYSHLWNTFVEDCKNMEISPKILDLIKVLREKFYVVLITENMDCFDRFTVPALQLDDFFDVIVNSYSEGILKSENKGETFLKYVQGNIADAFLIEDSSKSCAVFKELGGTALQVVQPHDTLCHLKMLTEMS